MFPAFYSVSWYKLYPLFHVTPFIPCSLTSNKIFIYETLQILMLQGFESNLFFVSSSFKGVIFRNLVYVILFSTIIDRKIKGDLPVSFVPKLAVQLQTFDSLEEFNRQMNLHYYFIGEQLTPSFDQVFHLLKKHSCKAIGVCWLKQETIANLLNLSIKTVERAIKFFKEQQVIKIYHTKRGNLNGNCYYVFQPCHREIEEEIIEIEESIVGAEDQANAHEYHADTHQKMEDKLLESSDINSSKSSIKNSKLNSNKISLSQIENYITRNAEKIRLKQIDTNEIYEAFQLGLVNDTPTFLIVLDRVIDYFTVNFKRCLHTSLKKESEQLNVRLNQNLKQPIRKELLPTWFDEQEEMKSETLEQLEEKLNTLQILSKDPERNDIQSINNKIDEIREQITKKIAAREKLSSIINQLRESNNTAV